MSLEAVLLVVYVLLAFALIGLILIQHGKGADAGAAFGSGASGTVFGSSGSASFLTKLTTWLAILFFALCIGLAYLSANKHRNIKDIDQFALPQQDLPVPTTENQQPTTSDAPVADLPAADLPAANPPTERGNNDLPTSETPAN